MRKTTSHWLALLPLTLGLSLPTLLPVTLGVALWSSPALADKAAPFPIFNDNGGKRDRFQHLLFLAETAKDSRDRGRKYRNLGSVLQQVGRTQEGLRAYEAGALEGDGPSASIVLEAMLKKRYKPRDVAGLVSLAVLPKAESGNVSAVLLMADLVGQGRVKGAAFHTSGYWLDKAARLGSGDAQRALAESAERRGDIGTAASYYAMLDRTGGKLARALHQARAWYLGKEVKQNSKIALAWLAYAGRIDKQAAGKLAAKLIRQAPDSDGIERLLEITAAAGLPPPSTSAGGPSARLAAAETPEARQAVLADLETAAKQGSGNAAIVLWRAREADGVTGAALAPYLAMATRAGSGHALGEAMRLLLVTPAATPESDALVAAIDAVATEGDVDALKALGNLYAAGGPVEADATRSLAYFRAAADQGDVESQFKVGLYFSQDTLTADAAELARHYLEAAATQGFAPAKAYLDQLPAPTVSPESVAKGA